LGQAGGHVEFEFTNQTPAVRRRSLHDLNVFQELSGGPPHCGGLGWVAHLAEPLQFVTHTVEGDDGGLHQVRAPA
jgi:hypothetical protein